MKIDPTNILGQGSPAAEILASHRKTASKRRETPNQPYGMTSKKYAGKTEAERIAEENQVLDLKRDGMSDRAIAAQVGVNHATVQNRLKAALTRHGSLLASEYRSLAMERLEELYRNAIVLMASDPDKGINAAVKIIDRIAKLQGLDAPTLVEVTQESESDREIKTLLGLMKTGASEARQGLEAVE